ncbi:MAG: hypothetical protein L3K03_00055 [Thermoplasmata archaeon]|nr:hypothetical protein [Thermoplasmata archaeon]
MSRSGQRPRSSALLGISLALVATLLLVPGSGAAIVNGPDGARGAPASPLGSITTAETTTAFWNNSSTDDQFSIGLQPSSTFGTIGLTLNFGVVLNATGGGIDTDTSRVGNVSVAVPANASLELDVLGLSGNLSIPPLIGSDVNIPIPGLYYTVPILNDQIGISLSMMGNLTGRGTVSGNGTGGVGAVSWNRSTVAPFKLSAGSSPGTIRSSLSDIRYNWTLGILASGCVPVLGCVSYALLPYVSLGAFAGSVDGVTATYVSVPDPTIGSILESPLSPTPGSNLSLATTERGGVGRVQFEYEGLPSGCSTAGVLTVNCPMVARGNYTVNVTAVDQEGQRATETMSFQVVTPSSATPGTQLSSSGGVPLLYWILLPVAVVAAIAGTVLVMRRRPNPP